MKKYLFSLLLFPALQFAQEKPNKLGAFGVLDVNIGLDLASIIRNNQAKTDYEKSKLPPGKFSYGFTSRIGFQPLTWFALSGGVRYSYIDPNYHMLYAMVQPQFFVGDPRDEDFIYIFANMGTKINQTAATDAGFVGLGLGKMEPINKRFGHKFQIGIENQVLDGESCYFVGISYGIILFTNKNI